ncbi:MAG TPA: hypothetical protein VJR70_03055, partial [Stellaceae bacterium]|nr:hypothetical protein [Stellaceae bacterium]
VIEGDNGFAATFPNEREGILSSLKAGADWIKNRCPNREQIFSLIISPLQWISGNFSKALIGEAAKKAAEAVVNFLHSLLS